jgi:iron complex outermembrane receptor protein
VAGISIGNLDCSGFNRDADEPWTNDSGADPVYKVVGVGSNGFPGYSPEFSEEYNRDSYAVYGDLSADVTDNLFLQAAVRFEDYSDFGNETVGKIAGRYRLNDELAIRGSFGTGFRAPTPGQQGTTNVSTRLPDGIPVATGLFPASGSVAQSLGATPLQAETSTSFTLGLTANVADLTLTLDYYQIDIDDRFRAISVLDVSTDPGAGDAYDNYLALVAAGVSGAETIGGVNYFTNAFDSRTTGFDIVASYPLAWDNGQDTNLQVAFNYNRSEIVSNADEWLNPEDQYDFENFDPNMRWNFTANHSFSESFSMMARARYFGESDNSDNTSPYLAIQQFGSTTFIDLEAAWAINDSWRVSVGGRNIFDEYPDMTDRDASDNDQCCGRSYVSGSYTPWQGGYYYGRVQFSYE